MENITTPCTIFSNNGDSCQNLNKNITTSNSTTRFKTIATAESEGLIFNIKSWRNSFLLLTRDGCFITKDNCFHCAICHRTVSQMEAREHLSSETYILNLFHTNTCTSVAHQGSSLNHHASFHDNTEQPINNLTATATASASASQNQASTITNHSMTLTVGNNPPSSETLPINNENLSWPSSTPSELAQSAHATPPVNTQMETNLANYTNIEVRKLSFFGCPPNTFPVVEDMADAGWRYVSGNIARCFYCHHQLEGWKPSCDPWILHAKYLPQCQFIIARTSPEFINMVQQELKNTQKDERPSRETNPHNQNTQSSPNRQETTPSLFPTDEALLNISSAKAMIEMNYPTQDVLSIIKTLLQEGKTLASLKATDIMKHFMLHENDAHPTQSDSNNSYSLTLPSPDAP